MSYEDRTLTCQDCGQEFTFSADDQQYHAEKGYTNEPKRCPLCRASRRSGDAPTLMDCWKLDMGGPPSLLIA